MATKPMRVCFFGTYRQDYNRNQILIAGLRAHGIEVIECQVRLWHGIEDRVQVASGGWLKPGFWLRVIQSYRKLLQQYRKVGGYDILMVGYPGHFDVYLAWLITRIHRKPLVWDVFNSLYLISKERGIIKSHPFTGWLIKSMEKTACNLPDMLFLDTKLFIEWFQNTHKLQHSRFRIVETGADDRIFVHDQDAEPPAGNSFTILFYGSYIPNHGVQYIAEAARLLSKEPDLQFLMVGRGPERDSVQQFVQNANLENVRFIDWLPKEELIDIIKGSHLVLGGFGTTDQVALTNNNKILEGFALEKPVLSGRTPALNPKIEHKVNIYLCERGSPQAIAAGILTLKNQPALRAQIAHHGYQLFTGSFSVKAIGAQLVSHLNELLS